MSKKRGVVFAILFAAGAGCGEGRVLTDSRPIIVAPFYVDEAGNPVGAQTPDATTILKVAGPNKVPVLASDGRTPDKVAEQIGWMIFQGQVQTL